MLSREVSITKSDFTQIVQQARGQVIDQGLLMDKWIDDPDRLYEIYKFEFKMWAPRQNASVFDLGTGPGYFLWFARECAGCSVAGLERSDRSDYRALWRSMGLEECIQIEKIKPFKDINYPGKFDYITAIKINFSRPSGNEWDIDRHKYFLKNSAEHLNDGGEMYFRYNYYPPEPVFEFLLSLAYWRDRKRLKIKKESILGLE